MSAERVGCRCSIMPVAAADADRCWPMLTDADRCWPMLIDAGGCWPMLTDADRCWPMLTDADRCWPMLTDADARVLPGADGADSAAVAADGRAGHRADAPVIRGRPGGPRAAGRLRPRRGCEAPLGHTGGGQCAPAVIVSSKFCCFIYDFTVMKK